MGRATQLNPWWGARSITLKRESIQLGRKLGKSAKRFSSEDEGCASEARSRQVGGPSRREAALWDQHDSPSIRLVYTLTWRAGEKWDCVFYKTTGRGSERGGGTGKDQCVTCRSSCSLKAS